VKELLTEIKKCTICLPYLKDGVNPVVSASSTSKIAIVGQAPGRKVHETGIPWDDKSGDRLRDWLGVSKQKFYNAEVFALVPMGFCYPGKGKSGDLPPRAECAPQWHEALFNCIDDLRLIILVGNYAQKYYLKETAEETLTETVKNYKKYFPRFLPLPHPSPRNNIWLKKNEWFEHSLLPDLKKIIRDY